MKKIKKALLLTLALVLALSSASVALAADPAETAPDWTQVYLKVSEDDEIPAGAYYLDLHAVLRQLKEDGLIYRIKVLMQETMEIGNPIDYSKECLKLLYPDEWAAALEAYEYYTAERVFLDGLYTPDFVAAVNEKMAALRAAYPDLVYWFSDADAVYSAEPYAIGETELREKICVIYLAGTYPEAYAAIPGWIDAQLDAYARATWYVDLNFSAEGADEGYLRADWDGEAPELGSNLFDTFTKNVAWKEVKESEEGLQNGDYYVDTAALRAFFERKFDAVCDEDGAVTVDAFENGVLDTLTLTKEEYVDRQAAAFLDENDLFVNPGDDLFEIKVVWMARYDVQYLPLKEKISDDVDMTAEQCRSFIRLYEEAPVDPDGPEEPGDGEPASGILGFLNKIVEFFQKLFQFIRGLFGG